MVYSRAMGMKKAGSNFGWILRQAVRRRLRRNTCYNLSAAGATRSIFLAEAKKLEALWQQFTVNLSPDPSNTLSFSAACPAVALAKAEPSRIGLSRRLRSREKESKVAGREVFHFCAVLNVNADQCSGLLNQPCQ